MSTPTEDAAFAQRRALDLAIGLLVERDVLTVSDDERQVIQIQLPLLRSKREKIQQLIATGQLPIVDPPSAGQIQAAKNAANSLDDISAQNTTAAAILAIVRDAADVIHT